MYYAVAGIWGIAQGIQIANLLAVVYDFCGADQLAVLFGLELFTEGIGGAIGPPLCGKLTTNPTFITLCIPSAKILLYYTENVLTCCSTVILLVQNNCVHHQALFTSPS